MNLIFAVIFDYQNFVSYNQHYPYLYYARLWISLTKVR